MVKAAHAAGLMAVNERFKYDADKTRMMATWLKMARPQQVRDYEEVLTLNIPLIIFNLNSNPVITVQKNCRICNSNVYTNCPCGQSVKTDLSHPSEYFY